MDGETSRAATALNVLACIAGMVVAPFAIWALLYLVEDGSWSNLAFVFGTVMGTGIWFATRRPPTRWFGRGMIAGVVVWTAFLVWLLYEYNKGFEGWPD
jgi:hypothetical protein